MARVGKEKGLAGGLGNCLRREDQMGADAEGESCFSRGRFFVSKGFLRPLSV